MQSDWGNMTMIADTVALLSGRWWAFLLRGLVALALAVFAFVAPGSLATVLVYVVAAYFIINGLFALISGVSPFCNPLRLIERHM